MATQTLCFNHYSLNTDITPQHAYALLYDSFQGALYLNKNGDDTYVLYYEQASLGDCLVGKDYTFYDFKTDLLENHERDFYLFLSQIEDRSPYIDFISNEHIDELDKWTVYFPTRPYEGDYMIICLAWSLQGFVISLNTDPFWNHGHLKFAFTEDHCTPVEFDSVKNIASVRHGVLHRAPVLETWEAICPDAILCDSFLQWEESRIEQHRVVIREKIQMACTRNFDLKRPLVDTLTNSKFSNLKELRVGGQLRIFFARLPDRRTAILGGLFKQGKERDYLEPVRKAEIEYEKLLTI